MLHLCPTCGAGYRCPRAAVNCASPYLYDCIACYRRRYGAELERLMETVGERWGLWEVTYGNSCDPH